MYARILGINPVHFNQSSGNTVFNLTNQCSDVWPQHSWQNADMVSREDLSRSILDAEEDIARELGFYPAPKWIAQEVHRIPRHHRRDIWKQGGRNVRGARVSVTTRYGKFINSGQRGTTLVGTATVAGGTLVYSDADGDGVNDTATITLATALTDECEIKMYFTGQAAAPEWEIRPARSVTIAGGNVVLVFDSWLLIDPDLWEVYPTPAGFTAIDFETGGNFVTSVDVYREFNDFSQTSATFFWEPAPRTLIGNLCNQCGGSECPACSLTEQDGCAHPRDNEKGIVIPVPATYDADTGQWDQVAFTECRDPDQVRLYYYAGDYSNRWLSGLTCDPLDPYWAQPIAWMATARLERPFCSCGNVVALSRHLQQDLAFSGEFSHQMDLTTLGNPFGTRRGEVLAWNKVARIRGNKRLGGGAI
jgi:hypothetical protein